MRSNPKLGRISGIEIGLHYGWFIVAALSSPPANTSIR